MTARYKRKDEQFMENKSFLNQLLFTLTFQNTKNNVFGSADICAEKFEAQLNSAGRRLTISQ
jgi:hypothetical protein